MAELSFFIGKGGVGKTTVSSAYAVREAVGNPRKKFLLLSTDPAHSLGDVFKLKLGDRPQRVRLPKTGNLFAWQINAEKQFLNFLKPYREDLIDLIESGTIFSRGEIEPLLETTLPGMAEMSALIAIDELLESNKYDHIVVDTAPIGHTLRMFELPQHFARFLEFLDIAGSRDRWLQQRFGGAHNAASEPFLARWQKMVTSVKSALSAEHSQLFMVTSPEGFSLNEAVRSADALASSVPDLKISAIVLNRAVTGKSPCPVCTTRGKMTAAAKKFVARDFRRLPLFVGEDLGSPVLGASALAKFGDHLFGGKKAVATAAPASKFPATEVAPWPKLNAPLVFTMGKGGVGKTTVSAALGFKQRVTNPKKGVTVCSTDPAPSLDDVFQQNVTSRPAAVLGDKKFHAMEIDSVAEFRRWAAEMQDKINAAFSTQSGGIHVDMSFDRQIFSSLLNIVPPGVDEIFAIFKILDLLPAPDTGEQSASIVIIDMAPTGHALELLRMPERMLMWSRLLLKSLAPHRTLPLAQDVAVEIASLGQQVRELAKILQDPKRSCAMAVMLAEPMPDQETARLLASLKNLQVSVQAVFANRIVMNTGGRCPRCTRARQWQAATLAGLKKRFRGKSAPTYLLPNFPGEIAGKQALRQFTDELWRLA